MVFDQRAMGFDDAKLPRKPRVVDRALRSRPRSAVVAGNENDLGARFRHAAGDRAHTRFRNEFHGNARVVIGRGAAAEKSR